MCQLCAYVKYKFIFSYASNNQEHSYRHAGTEKKSKSTNFCMTLYYIKLILRIVSLNFVQQENNLVLTFKNYSASTQNARCSKQNN